MDRIERIHFFIDKLKPEAQIGALTPETKDEAINLYITELFNRDIEKYQEDRIMTARLQKFEVRHVFVAGDLVSPTNDTYTIPAGYQRFTGFGAIYGGKEVPLKELPEIQFNRVNTSGLLAPDTDFPVCVLRGGTIKVSPSTVGPVIYWLRAPAAVRWGYTIDPGGLSFSYAKTGGSNGDSIDPEYPSSQDFSILKGSLKYMGIALGDDRLVQTMAEFTKQQ